MQFTSLELEVHKLKTKHKLIFVSFQYRKVVRENEDLRRRITKLEARVKLNRKKQSTTTRRNKSKTSFF